MPDRAEEQSSAIGNPTAKTNLAVSAHGTSDLISYLKYSLLNNSNIIIWPFSPKHCVILYPSRSHIRTLRRRGKGLKDKTTALSHITARSKSVGSWTPAANNSPTLQDVTETLHNSLEAFWALFEKSLIAAYCCDTQSTEHCTSANKKLGPKKEEKTLCAIGRPENEEHIRVLPLTGGLSRQKEITEPFVLTVAKPLPQKKERKKCFAHQDKATSSNHVYCCHPHPHTEHLQLYLSLNHLMIANLQSSAKTADQ